MGPIGCVAAVTYRCNSRCAMCDIWKQTPAERPELSPEDYRWLPASLRSINVSGGEPFLRDDLVEIVRVMREACPRARVVISTNGLATQRIVAAVPLMRDVAVRVSVDGVGEAHDTLRGVQGAWGSRRPRPSRP
jgi:MoaA/NifB/PqqE/SkfB family radical SAM enzyme